MIDTHCHLDSCGPDDAELVQRARTAGVNRIATVGMNPPSIERALAAAREHDGVHAIVGHHPHEAGEFDDEALAAVERAGRSDEAVAIGETGLDYFRDRAPRDAQRRSFEAQIDLARELGLPLVVHTRAAEDDTFAILRDRAGGLTVVLHCFSAPDRLDECVERGYVCSFAGNVTYPKATDLQAAARDVPAELLMVETDSPYLAPQPVRGKPNEPANVVATAEHVAELRDVSYGELEAAVESTAARVFGW
ncbi:MAG: TatD family hydrolase [Actinomycetota bacterium]|nr:TatD family hydrolase [Actinomycetota bacterium]